MKFALALTLGLLFVACVSLASAEDPKAEPEPGAEPESEPEHTHNHDEDAQKGSVGKAGEAKAQNNPAAAPMTFPALIIFGMAVFAKYIL